MDKLKPLDCMRCGGSLELHTIQTGMSTMGSYVKCRKCGLQGKTFNDYDGNHMKLATEFWNARAADSINQALVDALGDAKSFFQWSPAGSEANRILLKIEAALLLAGGVK